MRIGDLGEDVVVELIAKTLISKPGRGEYLFYPEDARDILPRAPRILLSTDAYSASSLKLPWRDYSDVGWSAITGAISDIVAKGGIPHACMIALGLPPTLDQSILEDLLRGLREAADYYGVKIIGGDTNTANEAWIAVSTIGFTSARVPPSRGGLKPGDYIVVTGLYGAMGYLARNGVEKASSLEWIVKYTKRPITRVDTAFVIENNYKYISASMDVSDGLGYTLHTMSKLSDCGILVEKPPLVHSELYEYCKEDEECLVEYSLQGGEEYGVVLGVKSEYLNLVQRDLEYFNIPYGVIGRSVSQPGLYYRDRELKVYRYDQFKGWCRIGS
ncbi:MAG: thiamine-phosphate kinase [Desulfurococcaceae archaeon]|nr:thiamine-phosphate kinase [Desulfurococcaceae archaeon]